MSRYFYIAKSIRGEEKFGEMEVKDEHQLARTLHEEGYVLISANLEKETKKKDFNIDIPFLSGVGLDEKIFFTRNLRIMISAGISLPRALQTLADISKNKKLKGALSDIIKELNRGQNFSDSLIKHSDIFSDLFCSMVKSGEEAGTLEDVLKNLTQQMERENDLKSKIKGAMIYPAFILSAMVGIGILMLVMVVPKLAETFEGLGIELPLTTRIIISVGTFMAEKWYLGLLIIAGFIFFLRVILKSKKGKSAVDNLSLKIPVISKIVQKTNSAYTVRTLGSLINSGVPITRALEITAGSLSNSSFKHAIVEATEKVRKGQKLSEALKPYENLYPSLVIQMVAVGEETGETAEILQKLADFFEEEVANATKNLSAIIEPALMLVIGGAIGFFAISMVQPMYSMLGSIK